MKRKMGIGSILAELREKHDLTLREAAEKCDLSYTLICKIENNRPCRWETVHILLTAAYGVGRRSQLYKDAKDGWMRQRTTIAEAMPADHMKKKASDQSVQLIRELREKIKDLDENEINQVRRSIYRSLAKIRTSRIKDSAESASSRNRSSDQATSIQDSARCP